jgi:RNA polymerase sigma-70 factor (ECF subfamily)
MTTIEFNSRLLELENKLPYFAYSLTTDAEDAKDLVQETMLKALSNREKFTDPRNFNSWAYTIMKNTFINNYRRNVKSNTIFNKIDNNENLAHKQEAISPESENSYNELKKRVDGLQDDFRVPFQMFTDGYKYKEIAEKLDIPIGTVKSKIFFARQKLMDTLPEYKSDFR